MRKLFMLLFGVAFLLALAVPATYLLLERDLPPLQTRPEILHTLKIYVEGQREQVFAGVDARLVQPFAVLGKGELSPALVSGALAVDGCPDYFALPQETGATWAARLIAYGMGQGMGGPGPGRCELDFADRLAGALGLPSDAHRAVAIQQLHAALDKRDLLDLELSSRYFAPGVLGVEAASRHLMGKSARALTLAEAAELLMAERDYDAIWRCKNPTVLRLQRNNVISQMAAFKLVDRAAADRAKGARLHCLSRPG